MGFCTEIVCDGCGESMHINYIVSKASIIKIARENGWSIGEHELCPSCRKISKKLKEERRIR